MVLYGSPLQYSCLENPMDRGAWWAAVHGVAKSRTQLSDFTFTFDFHALEKEMATHSSVLVWRIPGMAEPGGLLSMGSHRVRHDWNDLAAAAAAAATYINEEIGTPRPPKSFWVSFLNWFCYQQNQNSVMLRMKVNGDLMINGVLAHTALSHSKMSMYSLCDYFSDCILGMDKL